ncbi:Nramp family divalent metal transporter [Moorella sulfitireducens (nom. illeg.)]|uniref:Nramp family divalent metal transporter n=1 Tax=Neomoorella sulfitireducens TaxID=2972948 RepID=UPI0021AD1AE3|nr:Nramp family divalent metal transporter [Moorella sulfitireducens]
MATNVPGTRVDEVVHEMPQVYGPPYEQAKEMPAPLPFNWSNIWKIIGPGFIVLSLSIGSGEWLMGPASVLQYGPFVLWIVTIGIITQAVFNMTCLRYTLYTGEPIMVGFSRLMPGAKLWAPIWIFISFISIGPGWASGSATALAAMFLRRMPQTADKPAVMTAGIILFLSVVTILMFGGKIESLLEKINKWVVAFIFASLLILVIMFAPFSKWVEVAAGFFQFGKLPAGDVNWFLLAGLAGYAGAGGILNMGVTNWARDKGYGMGAAVGYIPSLIGGKEVHVAATGKIPPYNKTTIERFKDWWRYSLVDQIGIWALGAFIGMFLCVLLAYALVPGGTKLSGWDAAAHQANAVGNLLGGFGWIWVLLIGFWVLYGSQLSNSETFVRQVTDLLWNTSSWAREKFSKNDIRRIYYGILVLFTIWSIWLFFQGSPLFLVAFMANAANLAFTVAGIQLLFLDRIYPKELKTPLWAKLVLVVLILFYGTFTFIGFGTQFFGLKF